MNQETQQPMSAPAPTPQDVALLAAFDTGRSRHNDFDLVLPIMDGVVRALYPSGLYPDWSHVTADDFIEALYAVARFASFTEEARRVAFAQQPKGIM